MSPSRMRLSQMRHVPAKPIVTLGLIAVLFSSLPVARAGPGPPQTSSNEVDSADQERNVDRSTMLSLVASRVAHRIRQELSPLYPDIHVQAVPRSPDKVEVFLTAWTSVEPDETNGPFVIDYIRKLVRMLMEREFPGVGLARGSRFVVEPYRLAGDEDRPPRDNADWRSRVPKNDEGLSRRLEGRIRHELLVRYPFVQCRVWFLTPQEVCAWVRITTSDPLPAENSYHVREFARRTVVTILANEHPNLVLSARSHFTIETLSPGPRSPPHSNRVQPEKRSREERLSPRADPDGTAARPSSCGRFSRASGDRDECTGGSDLASRKVHRESWPRRCADPAVTRGRDGQIQAPIQALRSRVIELPTAHVLRPGERQTEVFAFSRRVGNSVFSNTTGVKTTGLDLTYRQGALPNIDVSLAYRTHQQSITPKGSAVFSPGSSGQGVLSGGVKCRVLPRVNGVDGALGATVSLVSDLDRSLFLPDEYEKFINAFAVVSTPFAPGFRGHAVVLVSRLLASSTTPANNSICTGVGVEFLPFEEVRFQMEVVGETLSEDRVGGLGTLVKDSEGKTAFGGAHVNVGMVAGLKGIGDLQLYGRKLNQNAYREMGASLFTCF